IPNFVALQGTVSDDGLPLGSAVNVYWQKLSGPGPVYFNGSTNISTNLNASVSFAASGVYGLRLTANDSALASSADVTITVLTATNLRPLAYAGPDLTVVLPQAAVLDGAVFDDGLPVGYQPTFAWTKVSGPGTVVFTPASGVVSNSLATSSATFSTN